MESDQSCRRGISSLPLELIFRIISFIDPFTDPASVVNFARTAKLSASKSHAILARHKAAHEKYRVISDLHPSTVPALIRSALGYSDPIDAWHVRSFEVWGTRGSWDEWRAFNLEEEGQNTVQGGEPPLAWTFENGEDRKLIDAFRDYMPEEDQRLALEELQRGGDGFLKMVLLCHLPRLVDIKVTRGEHGLDSCVGWLVKAVAWFSKSKRWPPGLEGLRDVAIGVRSGTWRDEVWDECSPYTLTAILRLPQLRSLYLNDIDLSEDENGQWIDEYILPPTSTVSHLFLDNASSTTSHFQNELVRRPRALESFAVRVLPGSELTLVDAMVNRLSKAQGDTLEHLMLYNPGGLSGDHCQAYLPRELGECRALRQVSMSVWDIELHCCYDSQPTTAEAFSRFFVEAFPRTLEVLVCLGRGSVSTTGFLEEQKFYLAYFDLGIVRMIESGLYPNLKAIFFEDVDIPEECTLPGRILLQEAMATGERHGVEIYKYSKPPKKRVDRIEFHAPPGKYDLVSGPHWRKDREGLAVNPFNGEWEAR